MKRFSRSFILSVIGHIAFIALLVWLGERVMSTLGGGTGGSEGEVVSVWISGPSGTVVSGSEFIPRSSLFTPRQDSQRKVRSDTASFEGDKSKGDGLGSGGQTGEAVGKGKGKSAGGGKEDEKILREIWKKIDRNKRYPMIARKRKIEGTPKVSFELDANGNVKWVKLVAGCGNDLLDEAAIETVKRASPLPAYPHPITLSIRYSLSE